MLKGKKLLLGVTGGIAAYKSAFLVRLLVKAGADVRVVMTPAAHEFITPLTLATLSRHPALTAFTEGERGEWNNHVELGLWADLMVIAPASANTLAKLAEGRSDNLLTAVFLSARCPVLVAPAMDLDMYAHPATQTNLLRLQQRGTRIIPPGTGELASGLSGEGRMAEPEEITAFIEATFAQAERLAGKKILVTAGPTYEPIDPVRFIGNHSTGKMGFALAEALAERGAEVELVSGPVQLVTKHPRIRRTDVTTAKEMYDAAVMLFPSCDGAILSAAVADYRPATPAGREDQKGERRPVEHRAGRNAGHPRPAGPAEKRHAGAGGLRAGNGKRNGQRAGQARKKEPRFHRAQFAPRGGRGFRRRYEPGHPPHARGENH
jgi:phosphopantothenoylcysteine decarboxylase / phosphopantothenate---cysteine ligase